MPQMVTRKSFMVLNPTEVRQLIRLATRRTGSVLFDDDLTQEACMRALDAFRRAGHVQYPRAFLMKIVCDTVRDHWRRRRPTEPLDLLDERFLCFTPNFENEIDRTRQLNLLQTSLDKLEPARRHVLELFYVQGLQVREIALRERRSQSAIKMDLLRGRQKLARLMGVSPRQRT
jgi:RNA polymerase sigma-70 factor (ECF subfamily)